MDEFKTAAKEYFEAISTNEQEKITAARIELFKLGMVNAANSSNDEFAEDLEMVRAQLGAEPEALILKLYKVFFHGFMTGMNAITAYIEDLDK